MYKPLASQIRRSGSQPAVIRQSGRWHSSSKSSEPPSEKAVGPNQDVLPHVSEEAAAVANIKGETPPELEQGTPVADVIERDEDAKAKAPKVLQEAQNTQAQGKPRSGNNKASTSIGSDKRSFSTFRASLAEAGTTAVPESDGLGEYDMTKMDKILELFKETGGLASLKSELKQPEELAMNSGDIRRHKKRYDSLVEQMTNEMMLSGKKARAQKFMAYILAQLQQSPAPNIDPRRPMLPGSPDPKSLPLDPIAYLTTVVDSIAPMLRMRAEKGAAGGGKSLMIPLPLSRRQRRKKAIGWILETASKKAWRGSGDMGFPHRVSEEVISIAEGRSSIWEKRRELHKSGVSARETLAPRRRRRVRL
ncbi:MAG: hypothetical protein M1814_001397 [Vezdaea aestivalis]|nr:MAG: hypothetical protein M1814_001397 [Vezdaea aestivalis]